MTKPSSSYKYPGGEFFSLDRSVHLVLDKKQFICKKEGELLWEKKRLRWFVRFPQFAYVSNDGHTAFLFADHNIYFFNPSGEKIKKENILWILSSDPETKKKLGQSTAGTQWDNYPNGFYFEHEDKSFFYILTWYKGCLLFNASTGEQVPCSDKYDQAVSEALITLVSSALKDGLEFLDSGKYTSFEDNWHPTFRNLLAAVPLIGRYKLIQFPFELGYLEGSNIWGGTESNFEGGGEYDCLRLSPYTQGSAIRSQTGINPLGYPAYWFDMMEGLYQRRSKDWPEIIPKVKTGLTPKEILSTLGPPFWIREGWDYDYIPEDEEPFTFRIMWGKETIESFEFLPPQWETENRDGPSA